MRVRCKLACEHAAFPFAELGCYDAGPTDSDQFPPCVAGTEPGCPCGDNGDCDSEWCVESPAGKQCSALCSESCPSGWQCSSVTNTGGDTTFICVPSFTTLCSPCRVNEDCVSAGARCLPREDGAGSFCGTACETGDDCPPAYECREQSDVNDLASLQCVLSAPVDAAGPAPLCACNGKAIADGASTACSLSNDAGTCSGNRACSTNGLTACDAAIPVIEVCDGKDQDCDGQTDETDDGQVLATPCSVDNDAGSCSGVQLCSQGALLPCDAATPSVEICDGLDSDCSGIADDNLGVLMCGKGECAHEVQSCVAGMLMQCDPLEGAVPEVCDGLDNDCNGLTDDGFPELTCGAGQCAKSVAACALGQVQQCNPFAGSTPEGCDLVDNDCDGETDEELGAVACGLGACAHSVEACVRGAVQFCNPFEGASAELCDGIDNDCDGTTDEGLPDITCGDGECVHTVDGCTDGQPVICDPLEGAEEELCDTLDNDCDGDTDEDFSPITCGKGECLHTVGSCIGGETATCDPLAGQGAEVCDNKDNDCDGDTDEDFGTVQCGKGACEHTLETCVEGVPSACDAFKGAVAEVCDGVDNDCDGETDEELGVVSCGLGLCLHSVPACTDGTPAACDPLEGKADEVCDGEDNDCNGVPDDGLPTITCGLGNCAHTVASCVGGQPNVCDPLEGKTDEVCDGQDNDCNGEPDDGLPSITCGLGQCNHTVASCVGGQPNVCDPLQGKTDEVCDGEDNDCNGVPDDELEPISCGLGDCAHAVDACVEGIPNTCDPLEGKTDEVCDGEDNDCNGEPDDGLQPITCGKGQCEHTVAACVGGQPNVCDPLEGKTDEVCDEVDNDCDGPIDEGVCAPQSVELSFGSLLAPAARLSAAAGSGPVGPMKNATGFQMTLGLTPLP